MSGKTKTSILGNKYGRLLVVEKIKIEGKKDIYWKCKCDCGNIVLKIKSNLERMKNPSCGCANRIDHTGKRFGNLVAISYSHSKNGRTYWLCQCDCGNKKTINIGSVVLGHTLSCGCYGTEMRKKFATTHGKKHTKLYKIWEGIKDRTNPNHINCQYNYRKLNIKMCDEWRNDFMSFYNWAIANGYKEEKLPNGRNKYEIDRINTYGNYEPNNCRWITQKEQLNNQTTNKLVTYKGKTQTLAQWKDELGFNYSAVQQRLKRGWDVERAFTQPVKK